LQWLERKGDDGIFVNRYSENASSFTFVRGKAVFCAYE